MQKNVAGQKWIVYAFDPTTGLPVTGAAASITANLRLDGGAANPTDDVNPTELELGYYYFDISQAESNADLASIHPVHATPTLVVVIGVPGAVWTQPAGLKYPATLAAGDVTGNLPAVVKAEDDIDFGATKKASLNEATPASVQNVSAQTGDAFAAVGTLSTHMDVNLDAKVSTRAPEAGGNLATVLATIIKILQILGNRVVVDLGTGVFTIYADDETTPLATGTILDDGTGRLALTWL